MCPNTLSVESGYFRTGGEQPLSGQALANVAGAILVRGAHFRFRARGWSMMPYIRDGDLLTLSPISGTLRLGDVVGFVHPPGDHLVVHRVVGRTVDGWLLRGDSLPEGDGRVDQMHILGRVTRVERGGRVVRFGLGPERAVIAWLSSHGLLCSSMTAVRRLRGRIIRAEGHDD